MINNQQSQPLSQGQGLLSPGAISETRVTYNMTIYQAMGKHRLKLSLGALLLLLVLISPLYVVHQLYSISSENLKAVLLSFLFSILLDYIILRPLVITLLSCYQARSNLRLKAQIVPTTPRWSLENEQLNLLGEFYQDYGHDHELHTAFEENSTSTMNYETQQPMLINRLQSEEDEQRGRSANGGGSERRLLSPNRGVTPQHRVHQTRIPEILLLEQAPQRPLFVFKKGTVAVAMPEEKEQTSSRLMGLQNYQSGLKNSNLDMLYGQQLSAGPDEEDIINGPLKIIKTPNEDNSDKYDEQDDDEEGSIEEIDIAGDSSLREVSKIVPPNTQEKSRESNHDTDEGQRDVLPMITTQNQQVPYLQQSFETPKLTPEEVKSYLSFREKKAENSKNLNSVSQSRQDLPLQEAVERENSLLEHKKKLLRELILEASSNDSKSKPVPHDSSGEFRSLRKYLATQSQEGGVENETRKRDLLIEEKDQIVLEETDIGPNFRDTKKSTWHQKLDQFSPKYNSENKSARQQISGMKQGPVSSSKKTAVVKNLRGSLLPEKNNNANSMSQMDSQKRAVSIGYSGHEDVVGSYRQPVHNNDNPLRTSSNYNNLLRSVLSQHREKEPEDFSDILAHSPKGAKTPLLRNTLGGSFQTPLPKNSIVLEGSRSKKKYGSIIVQPDHTSNSPLRENEDILYEEVQIQEEDEVIGGGREGSPGSKQEEVKKRVKPSQQFISIVQFQTEKDKMPKEEQFDKMKESFYSKEITASVHNQSVNSFKQLNYNMASPIRRVITQSITPTIHEHTQRTNESKQRFTLGSMSGNLSRRSQSSSKNRPGEILALKQDGLFPIKESVEFGPQFKKTLEEAKSGHKTLKVEEPKGHHRERSNKGFEPSKTQQKEKVQKEEEGEKGKFAYLHRRYPSQPHYESSKKASTQKMQTTDKTKVPEDDDDDTIEETKNGEKPTPSPAKIIMQERGKAVKERKVISFLAKQDNSLIGEDIPSESIELAALRRSKKQLSSENQGVLSQRASIEDAGSLTSQELKEMQETAHKRHGSNARVDSNLRSFHQGSRNNNQNSNNSSSRPKQLTRNYQPSFSNSNGVETSNTKSFAKTMEAPALIVNQHLKLKEEKSRREDQQAINTYIMEDQTRQLNKFLQLSRQLRKGKDEKKIMDLISSMKDSGRPLPLSAINQLKVLEIMNSPYGQPLQNMIKTIESQLTKKVSKEVRAASSQMKQSRRVSKRSDGLSLMLNNNLASNRQLSVAKKVYGETPTNKDAQKFTSNFASSVISRMSLSRESSADGSLIIGSHPSKKMKRRSSTADDKKIRVESSDQRQKTSPVGLRSRNPDIAVNITDQKQQEREEVDLTTPIVTKDPLNLSLSSVSNNNSPEKKPRDPSNYMTKTESSKQKLATKNTKVKKKKVKKLVKDAQQPNGFLGSGNPSSQMLNRPSTNQVNQEVLHEHENEDESAADLSQRRGLKNPPFNFAEERAGRPSGQKKGAGVLEIQDDLDSFSIEMQ